MLESRHALGADFFSFPALPIAGRATDALE
jgi:hypothetical protein